jgi:hypothetical protein
MTVRIPPCASAAGTPSVLARWFLAKYAREFSGACAASREGALAAIAQHSWPGNVRELGNRIQRAALMSAGPLISAADLELADRRDRAPMQTSTCATPARAERGNAGARARPQPWQLVRRGAAAERQPSHPLRPPRNPRPHPTRSGGEPHQRADMTASSSLPSGAGRRPGVGSDAQAQSNSPRARAEAAQARGDLRAAQLELRNAIRADPNQAACASPWRASASTWATLETAEREAKAALERGGDGVEARACWSAPCCARGRCASC